MVYHVNSRRMMVAKIREKVYMMAAQTLFKSILTLKDYCREAHQMATISILLAVYKYDDGLIRVTHTVRRLV
ncbi:hypothetical protein BDA96_10G086900 [Sorghum bicolor]|jgi:hypothetical protein|uniref:Uncharacterized protein n=1 Tax=Sorghum bicolor TaxID=4558 RepID=A0A921TZN4_SORBI|nr:hypothetical protein BDA96_10G086900 [Sorghum bicolor]